MLAGCTHGSTLSAASAVEAVFSLPGVGDSTIYEPFPRGPGKASCQIPRGEAADALAPIAGTCETKAVRSNGHWVVTLVETWDAAAFHQAGAPESGRLSHQWEFTLDDGGGVLGLRHWGDFPPQLVRSF